MQSAQYVDVAGAAALAMEAPSESDVESFLGSDDELPDDFLAMAFDPSITAASAKRLRRLRRVSQQPTQVVDVAPARAPSSSNPVPVPAVAARPSSPSTCGAPERQRIAPQQVVTLAAMPMQTPMCRQATVSVVAADAHQPPTQSLGQWQHSDKVARTPGAEFSRLNAGASHATPPAGSWFSQNKQPIAKQPPGSWFGQSKQRNLQQTGGVRLVKAARPPSKLRDNGRNITTLGIDNLPIELCKHQLLELIDRTGFEGRYDFVHLPLNKSTNQGHAFANFCSMLDARSFFAKWHGARVVGADGSSDGPVLSLHVCKTQGFESCVARWASANVRDPDRLPFVTRGGSQL